MGIGELRAVKRNKVDAAFHAVFFYQRESSINALRFGGLDHQKEHEPVVLKLLEIIVKYGDLVEILRRFSQPAVHLVLPDLREGHRFDTARTRGHAVERGVVADDDVSVRRKIQVYLDKIGMIGVVSGACRGDGVFIIRAPLPRCLRTAAVRYYERARRVNTRFRPFA